MIAQQRESIDVPIVFDRWNRGLQQNSYWLSHGYTGMTFNLSG